MSCLMGCLGAAVQEIFMRTNVPQQYVEERHFVVDRDASSSRRNHERVEAKNLVTRVFALSKSVPGDCGGGL